MVEMVDCRFKKAHSVSKNYNRKEYRSFKIYQVFFLSTVFFSTEFRFNSSVKQTMKTRSSNINFLTSAYQGVKNARFSRKFGVLVFLLPPFRDSPFCLITDEFPIGL